MTTRFVNVATTKQQPRTKQHHLVRDPKHSARRNPAASAHVPTYAPRSPRTPTHCVSPPVSAGPTSTGFTGIQGPTRWPEDAVAPCATVVRRA